MVLIIFIQVTRVFTDLGTNVLIVNMHLAQKYGDEIFFLRENLRYMYLYFIFLANAAIYTVSFINARSVANISVYAFDLDNWYVGIFM